MHNAVIIWTRDIGLPSLIMRKAVYWSESRNTVDTHTHTHTQREASEGEIKGPHTCRPALTHRTQMGISPPSLPPCYVSSLYLWSRSLFSIPPSFSRLSFTSPCNFDHSGWKSIGGPSLSLNFNFLCMFYWVFQLQMLWPRRCIWPSMCVLDMCLCESCVRGETAKHVRICHEQNGDCALSCPSHPAGRFWVV